MLRLLAVKFRAIIGPKTAINASSPPLIRDWIAMTKKSINTTIQRIIIGNPAVAIAPAAIAAQVVISVCPVLKLATSNTTLFPKLNIKITISGNVAITATAWAVRINKFVGSASGSPF